MATRARSTVSVVLLRPLARCLESIPGALDAFWRATDLTPVMLADAEARVSPAQFCVAWAEALRSTRDPALALRIAETISPGAFGVVEYVCRSAPSLHEALRQWVRYLGILDDAVEVALVDLGAEVALRVVRESDAPAPAAHELCFALLLRRAQHLVEGRVAPISVRFSHPAPAGQLARYRAFFGHKVHFGADQTELSLPRDALDQPLATADPELLAILVATADERRAHATSDPPLTEQVRRALRGAFGQDDAQLEAIARRLGVTGRSLQRRLQDEGTSFQALRDDTRRALANRYLGEELSLSEISFLLGFSEPSAFFRAFKRWTGMTPVERRARMRASAP
jgi:AraC-like DNA-binding protein